MIGRQVRIRPGRRAQNVQLTELGHCAPTSAESALGSLIPPGALIAQREYRWSRPSRDIRLICSVLHCVFTVGVGLITVFLAFMSIRSRTMLAGVGGSPSQIWGQGAGRFRRHAACLTPGPCAGTGRDCGTHDDGTGPGGCWMCGLADRASLREGKRCLLLSATALAP
jgi:hypothetical protein